MPGLRGAKDAKNVETPLLLLGGALLLLLAMVYLRATLRQKRTKQQGERTKLVFWLQAMSGSHCQEPNCSAGDEQAQVFSMSRCSSTRARPRGCS